VGFTPKEYLHRDADVEAMSDGADDSRAYGDLQGDDDPTMGWSRYSQYWRLWALNSGCFYLRANERTRALLADAATHLEHQKDWDQVRGCAWGVAPPTPSPAAGGGYGGLAPHFAKQS
jgi:hypothetical protein